MKNAHYAIAAQVPWSIWAAMALARLGERLRRRGWGRPALRAAACGGFFSVALLYGMCLWQIAPRLDRRGIEWDFYESIGRAIPSTTSLTFLYDDFDRRPYECALGSFPHDLAVRLFYLGRPACWHLDAELLEGNHQSGCRLLAPRKSEQATGSATLVEPQFIVVCRDRDRAALERLGRVEIISRGPTVRADRSYSVFRISTAPDDSQLSGKAGSRSIY